MVADALEELLGLHPSSWTLIQQTAETIWRLAQMGHVILVGRGANLITAKLASVFHVRLIGSLEKRVAPSRATGRDAAAALAFVKAEDGGQSTTFTSTSAKTSTTRFCITSSLIPINSPTKRPRP